MLKTIKKDKLYYFFQTILLITLISFMIYIYLLIPKNALVSFPGPINTYAEEIGLEVDLYKVAINVSSVEERSDFIKILWNNKIWPTAFTSIEYDSFDITLKESKDFTLHALEAKRDKYDNLFDYFKTHYPDEDVVKISNIPKNIGDSDGLGLALSFIGLYDDAHWVNSDFKIVITGALDAEGMVQPVGSIHLKGIAAVKNEAEIFIVPQQNYDQLVSFMEKYKDIIVVPVNTIDEAVAWLNENA